MEGDSGNLANRLARRFLPKARARLARQRLMPPYWRPLRRRPRKVHLGDLQRTDPFSRTWGFDRGLPIDRYYIAEFLGRRARSDDGAPLVRGRVLEIGDADYAPQLNDDGAVEQLEILDASEGNPAATVIGDLADAPQLRSGAFDCIICTQTLHLIYDVPAAVRTMHRILKPGGTVLATVPGISQICQPEMEMYGDYWRFTTRSARLIFEEAFAADDLVIESYGNVLAASAFLYGLAMQDLARDQLDARDPDYQLLVGIRATKGQAGA